MQMTRAYNYGGSIDLRASAIDDEVRQPHSSNFPGGLTGCIEKYQALMAELDIIAPLECSDDKKQKLLLKNIRRTPGVAHLAQHCKDSDLSYDMSAEYLAQNAIIIDQDIAAHAPKRIMTVTEDAKESGWLKSEETVALFMQAAKETNIFVACRSFNNGTMRQSMRTPDDIWHALEPDIKDKINALRTKIRAEREAQNPKDDGTKATAPEGVPAQHPNMMKEAKPRDRAKAQTVTSLHNLNACLFECDDEETDYGVAQNYNVTTTDDDETAMPLTVHAYLEYATPVARNYAISDSGADSCCLGKHCHPVSHTGCHAILVGCNPDQTRSGKVPIVTACIKVMSQMNIPIVLQVHEAPHMQDSNVTLLSEHQVRENGLIINSVSKRHKTGPDAFGTQRMTVSEHIHVPFVDRGGLLGCEILPWEIGDEDVHDVFDITRDTPWKPRRFRDDEECHGTAHTDTTATDIAPETSHVADASNEVIEISCSDPDPRVPVVPGVHDHAIRDLGKQEPFFFDPEDAKVNSLGHAATMAIVTEHPPDTPADDLISCMTYRELTGFDSYDGYYDGCPNDVQHTTSPVEVNPTDASVLDLGEDQFNTRAYTASTHASWHRVLHDNLHPKELQPYLGWAPLRGIQRTLEVTTQLAKMVIRYPMRRHIRSRLSHMHAQRLNEMVSTDPMFANCRCFGPGWTGGQVFYDGLKSTKMDIIGFKGNGEFPRTYRDCIRANGVPSGLRRDNAKEE
jgi:hypothetical protein